MGDTAVTNLPQLFYLLLIGYVIVAMNITFGSWLRLVTGIYIDLIPLLIVYMALTSEITTMSLVGAIIGLFFDSVSANVLGVSSISFIVAGLIIYSYRHLVLRKLWQIQYLSGLLCSVSIPLITFILLKFIGAEPIMNFQAVFNILISGFFNAFLTPLIFGIIDWIENTFNYRQVKMSSFRPDREIKRGH